MTMSIAVVILENAQKLRNYDRLKGISSSTVLIVHGLHLSWTIVCPIYLTP